MQISRAAAAPAEAASSCGAAFVKYEITAIRQNCSHFYESPIVDTSKALWDPSITLAFPSTIDRIPTAMQVPLLRLQCGMSSIRDPRDMPLTFGLRVQQL